jgi:CRISPR-associated Csx2 family protein
MTLKAITFLGYTPPDRPYREATYRFEGQEWTTPFMAEATARFFAPDLDTLLVLVTREAEAQNLDALRARLPESARLRPVPIPSGLSADELWTMFSAIEGQIAPGDRIIFDITNGFRSLPVLAFLAASFVRVVRGALVERMIYGAFDATQDGITPVFDLTPFLTLLDWTTATDAFLKYGRADDLAALARTGDGGPLDALAAAVATLTAGLQTARPTEVQREADALGPRIDAARAAATPAPFDLLLDRIRAEYTPLGHPDPLDQAAAWEVLAGQAEIVAWCVRKGLYVQAITNAREWIVSLVVAAAGGDIFDNDRDRALAEHAINRPRNPVAQIWNGALRRKEDVPVPPAMRRAAQDPTLRKLWDATRDLRNDLSHTGMRRSPPPRPAAQVIAEVRAVCARVPELLANFRSAL